MDGDRGQRERKRDEEREMKERRNKGRNRFPSSLYLPPVQAHLRAFELAVPSGQLSLPPDSLVMAPSLRHSLLLLPVS